MTHEIQTDNDRLAFILAGKATFTIVNDATGGRFTFRARLVEKEGREPVHFVDVLTGPSNTGDFARLGMIFNSDRFVVPRSWTIGKDAPSAKAFEWIFTRVTRAAGLATVRFLHEGRCGRCNRALTVPESIESGLGPICAAKAA